MTGKVIDFRTGESGAADPDEDTVKMVEHVLAEAKAGRFVGVAYVGLTADESIVFGWTTDSGQRMAGAISMLQFMFLSDASKTTD